MSRISETIKPFLSVEYAEIISQQVSQMPKIIDMIEPATIDFNDEDKHLTQDETDEIHEALLYIFNDSNNIQSAFSEKLASLKPKLKDILRYIILQLILPTVFVIIANNMIYEANRPSVVRQSPIATPESIYNITVNQNFFVINSVPHYYEIEFFDNEKDKYVTGYILKRYANPVSFDEEEESTLFECEICGYKTYDGEDISDNLCATCGVVED